jgi:hypothetical protein
MDRKLKVIGLVTLTLGMVCVGWFQPFARNATSFEAPADRMSEAPHTERVVDADALKSPGKRHASGSTASSNVASETSHDAAMLERQKIVRREIDTRLNTLARTFDDESRDADWAEVAESVLGDIAGGPDLPGTRVQRVLCKQTLCMAEYAPGSRDETQRIAELADIGGSEGYFVEVDAAEGEEKHVLFYLARAGHSLPAMR